MRDQAFAEHLIDLGVLPLLNPLVISGMWPIQNLAFGCICCIAGRPALAPSITADSLAAALVAHLAPNSSMSVSDMVPEIKVLLRCSVHGAAAGEIAEKGGNLLSLFAAIAEEMAWLEEPSTVEAMPMMHEPFVIYDHAARLLAYFAYSCHGADCRDGIIHSCGVPMLVVLLSHASAGVVEQAAGALRSICTEVESSEHESAAKVAGKVAACGGLPALAKLLLRRRHSSSPGMVEHAAGALRAVESIGSSIYCGKIVAAGAVEPLSVC